MSRCFAFGCSFTKWFYPTWADHIGMNFSEYYNYANGALSNNTIAMRFVEADAIHKFNSDDLILVGLSGIGRYNFFVNGKNDATHLWGAGDLQSDALDDYIDTVTKWKDFAHIIKFMRDHYWQRKWGIYYTWLAVKTMKRILTSNNVKHIIIAGLDLNFYRDKELLNLSNQEVDMIEEVHSLLDCPESLQEYDENNFTRPYKDNHPFIESHLHFVKDKFPNLLTNKNFELLEKMKLEVKDITDQDTAYDHLMNYRPNLDYSLLRKLYGVYI
jgi:hypothetical protein